MIQNTRIFYYSHCDYTWINFQNDYKNNYNYDFTDDFGEFDDVITDNYQEAINKLKSLDVIGRPNITLSKIYHNLGVLNMKLKQFDNMIEYFNKAINLNYPLSKYSLAVWYYDQKDYENMMKILNDNISSSDNHWNIKTAWLCKTLSLKKLAQYYDEQQNYKEMFKFYKLGFQENDPWSFVCVGIHYHKLKVYKVAKKYFLHAFNICESVNRNVCNEPGSLVAYNLAKLYKILEDHKKSKKYFKITANLGDLESMQTLAIMYKQENNIAKTEKYLMSAYEHGDKFALDGLVELYCENENGSKEDCEKIIKYCDLALEKDIKSVVLYAADYFKDKEGYDAITIKYYLLCIEEGYQCYNDLGCVYARIGDLENALKYYKLGLKSNDLYSAYNLAFVYEQKDDFVKAEKYYLLSINSCDPNSDQFSTVYFSSVWALVNLYQKKGELLNTITCLVRHGLDKMNCKCKFRSICKFQCDNICETAKDYYNNLNDVFESKRSNYSKHEDYIEMLKVSKKYLSCENLKILNDYLCSSESIPDKEISVECPVCLGDMTKMIELYCSHEICVECYPHLKLCPICLHKV